MNADKAPSPAGRGGWGRGRDGPRMNTDGTDVRGLSINPSETTVDGTTYDATTRRRNDFTTLHPASAQTSPRPNAWATRRT